ncbi:MAG: choice-of-anchor D domain-containing protein [Bdellovibrionales bacterium]|nr:choice-of-anchor D domain-containing protein [Bdellovibrionales bacterium]
MKALILCLVMLAGTNAFAYISATPSFVSFGTLEEGSFQRSRTVSVRNNSDEKVNVRVSNSCFGNFWVTDSCFVSLRPYSSCTITVRYTPRRVGSDNCNIRISSDNGGFDSVNASGRTRERR